MSERRFTALALRSKTSVRQALLAAGNIVFGGADEAEEAEIGTILIRHSFRGAHLGRGAGTSRWADADDGGCPGPQRRPIC